MKRIASFILIVSILFSLSIFNFASAENINQNNSSLKIYLNLLIDVLYSKKQENISYYTDIDSVIRLYLKTDSGINSLSEDSDKVVELIGNKDDFLNSLKQNNTNLENIKKEVLNLKNWSESDRYLILDKIKEGQDINSIKSELDKLINKYNNTNSNTFILKDISNHWARDYILFMIDKKVTNGYSDSTFKPDNKITRAEFAKILVETLKLNKVVYNNSFSDVNNHWAKDYIQTAYNAGLIKGYDKTFKPNASITRSEMATMIGRTLSTDKSVDLKIFKDNSKIPSWAKEYVSKSVSENLITGDNSYFRPNDNTTRAEAITILYRLLNK